MSKESCKDPRHYPPKNILSNLDKYRYTCPACKHVIIFNVKKIDSAKEKNALEIAREYFPYAPDDWLINILWERTGYPYFWNTRDIEQELRKQLHEQSVHFTDENTLFDWFWNPNKERLLPVVI